MHVPLPAALTATAATLGLLLGFLQGCGGPAAPAKERPAMGILPTAVTSAEPLWIPFRAAAGKAWPADPRESMLSELRQLSTSGSVTGAAWEPSGRALIYVDRGPDGCQRLRRLNLSNGKDIVLAGLPSGSNHSPALLGEELVFVHQANCSAEATSTPAVPELRRAPYPSDAAERDVTFQPGTLRSEALLPHPAFDGLPTLSAEAIVFSSSRDGEIAVYRANRDGSGLQRLPARDKTGGGQAGARLSPDGSKLVWQALPATAPNSGPLQAGTLHRFPGTIVLAGSAGQHPRRLPKLGSFSAAPSFCGDSHHLLFSSDYDGGSVPANANAASREQGVEIYLIDPEAPARADGKAVVKRVSHAAGYDGDPLVSPDGHHLLFISERGATPGQRNLFMARWHGPR